MKISTQAAEWAPDELELLARGLDPFLGAVLQADVQQIIVIDGPAILGLEPPKPAIARQHNALAESVNGLYKSELIDTEHEGP